MAWGTMAVDWETRVDYDRLRSYRLQSAQEQLEKTGIGSFFCFEWYNIRYITGIQVGEWGRDKMCRYVLLPRGHYPELFEVSTAVLARKLYSPWIADHIRPSLAGWNRTTPAKAMELAGNVARTIRNMLADYGLEKEPVGVDICDMILPEAMRREGLEVVDAHLPMLDARLIKNQDEIQLMKVAATMVDAAYARLAETIRPGMRENELVGIANETLYRLGSEDVECVNAVSGPRSSPHPHLFADRMVRPGDFIFFDLMHAFNGYRTCYYRTFFCGRPTAEHKETYRKAYDWLYDAIRAVKPGVTTADIASKYPTCEAWGLTREIDAQGLATGHGIGLSIHEKPNINRWESMDDPFPIQEGMVFALETYAQTSDGKQGCRIEEECVVTKDGCEVITKFPCEELISVGVPKYW